ncbi:hypothetical protein UlMin_033880, partial [Ulmus minor]
MQLTEKQGIKGKTFAVSGGLGFVGSALCLELVRRGGARFELLIFEPLLPGFTGCGLCLPSFSFGMSGKEMLQFGCADEVNINETCHVLDACLHFGIQRLVYVSINNVVFGGNEIVNGNETLPYFPLDDHVDPYSRSKSIAEQLVLKNNGLSVLHKKKNGKCLCTCAVRPAAIYGPGEERHLSRIVSLAKLGLMPFKLGILIFEFLRPLPRSLDYDIPKASLSVPRALHLGRIFWAIYMILYPWKSMFSFLKAKEELGYIPMVTPREGMAATIEKKKRLDGPTIYAWLFSVIRMIVWPF